jgi:hypothetical protein
MTHEIAKEMGGEAFTKSMERHFIKVYSTIDNLKTEMSSLTLSVANLVEEHKKSGKVRGNVPDLELQPPVMPRTATKDLTIGQ